MGDVYDLGNGRAAAIMECMTDFNELVLSDVDEVAGLICVMVSSEGVVQASYAGLNSFEVLGVLDYAADILSSGADFLYEDDDG